MKVLIIEPRNCWIGLNIAIAYIAASLKRAGHEVRVLDFTNHRKWPIEEMCEAFIKDYRPDLIGMPLFYISYYPVKEMISSIKKYYSGRIVVGGPQMMIEKEQILHDIPELDFALVGDGEDAIVELCDALNGKLPLQSIGGLIYRDNGQVVRNPGRTIVPNIDSLPIPDYKPFGIEKIRRYTIITSRGCTYHCTYCFRSTPKWRPRSPENIIIELLNAIDKYQIEEFVIVDDAFNIRPERIEKFCDLLTANKISLPWTCSGVRADRMTESLAKKMMDAGCSSINVGVETLQPDVYEHLNRSQPIDSIVNCMNILKKYDFITYGYFMIGLPGDTKEKTWDTYRNAKRLGIQFPQFSILLPIPGTKMHDVIYNLPGVRKLEDYKRISTIWTFDPVFSRMKTAFETPEYSAKDKIAMYNRLRTVEGDPRPPYHKSLFVFGLHVLLWVFKYDLLHSPITIFKLSKNFLKRIINSKGRHVSVTDNIYKKSYLSEMEKVLEQKAS